MHRAMDMMEQWKPLCEKYNCSIANLSLAWIMGQGDSINVLNGCSKVSQLEENAESAHVELQKEDMEWMRGLADQIQ